MSVFDTVSTIVGMPARKYWVDYDEEADVLYVSFDLPQKATDTEMTDDGLLLRYRDNASIGITIMNASNRSKDVSVTA